MAIKKENYDTLFERLTTLENEIKELRGQVSEETKLFCKQKDVNIKSIKKAYKSYKEYLKNKDEFTLVDLEANKIIDLITSETIEEDTVTEEEDINE